MKILFTADLHIKVGQENVPVPWTLNRYNLLTKKLAELQDSTDIVILGGDIFDKLPNMDELDLYFKLIDIFNKPTYIIDGNHEATKKGKTFFTQLAYTTNKLNKNVVVIDRSTSVAGIDFIPYCDLKAFEKSHTTNTFTNRILVTHVRGEIPPHVKPEVDLNIFKQWDIVLAGDLHSYTNSQLNILYPGSPVTTSFHRKEVDTGVIILDTEDLSHTWVKLDMPQLLRKTIKAGEPMPATEYHHTIYEVEGDISELAGIEDSDLLDKKVVKRSTDTSLILEPEMTLAEEVSEYLTYILELDEESVQKALKELANYANKFDNI